MYSDQKIGYSSSSQQNLYKTVGIVGVSLIGFSQCEEINLSNYDIDSRELIGYSSKIDFDRELTSHALRLSESSLEEDWADEDEANWEQYL